MDSTLLKGLRVLETVARSGTPRGVSDLARELDLTRSNVHRTLQTLLAAGYARQSPDGRGYECTLKLFELASAIMERVDVRRCSGPHIRRLAELTEESVHLSALDGTDVVYLDKVESPQPIRAYSSVGGRAPAHCVASGKALLSWASEEVLAEVTATLIPHTNRSITDPDALQRELAQARRAGCAINRGEWRGAVGGIAAPVFNAAGHAEAAVGVSGPVERILEREGFLRGAVLDTARAISSELGCRSYPAHDVGEIREGTSIG
ncbi:IclR family transcriptional regulator [Pseudonocardia sp.]|uniref:IclR family transcriptional regulator n=1 Tax=Pseudonocardia sp. TaxID=60912 RepID=UPI003D115B52